MSDLVLRAISFAARAHRHQFRKDGVTPYAAHPMRVMFIARDLFSVTDPQILAAAVLHDTIEDTTTDFDDLAAQFGVDVAKWVAALTKDGRLPEVEREHAYGIALLAGGPPVIVCKLADMFDNLTDSIHLPPAGIKKTLKKIRHYLDILKPGICIESENAFGIVESKWQSKNS